MAYEQIIVEVEEAVGHIVFNRPELLNAYSERMSDELVQAVTGVLQGILRCVAHRRASYQAHEVVTTRSSAANTAAGSTVSPLPLAFRRD